MKFYEGDPPRHGHRSPAELADDEILASLRGDFCAMPEIRPDDEAPTNRERPVSLGERSSFPVPSASHIGFG
jgi:hypothetical protein